MGTRTQAQVTLDSLRTPRELVHRPWSHGTARRPGGTSDTITCRPGDLVDSTGPWTRARGSQESWSNLWASDQGPSRLGELVDVACLRIRAQVNWDSWLTPPDFRHGPESPGADGRARWYSDLIASHSGELVDPAGTQARARVARGRWLSLRALGHGPESPETAGRPCGPDSPRTAG